MKKTIIHFIFSLGRGGAETMVVTVIKELPEYRHVVVTLYSENQFGDELQCDKLISLNMGSLIGLPAAALKFKKVIRAENPALIHSHLFWPTCIARFSIPGNIPLITTIHQFIGSSVEYRHWYIRFLERVSYQFRKSIIIVVAKGALEEYFSFLKVKPYKAYVLHTFVDLNRFRKKERAKESINGVFRMVAVGALREQKNFSYLIDAMALLKKEKIHLDIFGVGNLQDELQKQIDATGAAVTLRGQVKEIENIIPHYDLFVMPSTYEGFSLGVLEAMALGMPLLLSDNPSFREQADEIAWFFSLTDIRDPAGKILELSKTPQEVLSEKGERGRQIAINNFSLTKHVNVLQNIYKSALL